jgi:hypothetical protein
MWVLIESRNLSASEKRTGYCSEILTSFAVKGKERGESRLERCGELLRGL